MCGENPRFFLLAMQQSVRILVNFMTYGERNRLASISGLGLHLPHTWSDPARSRRPRPFTYRSPCLSFFQMKTLSSSSLAVLASRYKGHLIFPHG